MEKIKVKSLKIRNFKGIKSLELDFTYIGNDKVLDNIVICGVNGSGKSTVLEAINLYLIIASSITNKTAQGMRKVERDLMNYISLGSEWIYHNEKQFEIDITLEKDEKTYSAVLTYHQEKGLSWNDEGETPVFETKDFFAYLSSYRLLNPSTVRSAGDWQEIERIEEDAFRNRSRYNMRFRRYGGYSRDDSFLSLSLQFENNYSTVKQYLVNLITDQKVETLTKENKKILEKIRKSFKLFFPNKEFLERLSRNDDIKDYRLMIRNEDNSVVDLDQLSSGEREVIAFFTYLCTKAINNSILIIDEPELHLHPKWQTIILHSLQEIFPESQIFLATHSNEIYQSSSASEIFELEGGE